MGLKTKLSQISPRFFGKGRFFIHNPFGSDFAKATDPHMNRWTLFRYSRSCIKTIREPAKKILLSRFSKNSQAIISGQLEFEKNLNVEKIIGNTNSRFLQIEIINILTKSLNTNNYDGGPLIVTKIFTPTGTLKADPSRTYGITVTGFEINNKAIFKLGNLHFD